MVVCFQTLPEPIYRGIHPKFWGPETRKRNNNNNNVLLCLEVIAAVITILINGMPSETNIADHVMSSILIGFPEFLA